MELEHILPKTSRRVDGERILDVCRRFANVLTDRTWNRDDVLMTRIQREIKRVFTFTEQIGSTELKTERNITVSADFYANKEPMGYDDEHEVALFDESYTISASLREQVRPDELPDWVLKTMVEKPLFRLPNTPQEEMGTTLSELAPELNHGVMYVIELEKVTEIEYTLDDEGFLDDYAVTCRYLYDDQLIDERTYSWADEMMGQLEDMTDNEALTLTDDEIRTFRETFDEVMRRILSESEDDDQETEGEQELDEITKITQGESEGMADMHYRRVFGMIALNAQRFMGMRLK